MAERFGLTVHAEGEPGAGTRVLHAITAVIAGHGGEVSSVDVTREASREASREAPREGAHAAADRAFRLSFELELAEPAQPLVDAVRALPSVREAALVKSLQRIYGKRIIIMGGGAQVGQVAIGAISEADRHNIRGERISVDTIPLVGEQPLADAVRAVARLPRACALVLAGSLMGGDIERAVREVRAQGLLVVSLNMAGSVPDAADLVVTDPVQAGVMTVMAVADTARFTVGRLKRRVF
jgi:energy-converting hydrogenase B subunit Q